MVGINRSSACFDLSAAWQVLQGVSEVPCAAWSNRACGIQRSGSCTRATFHTGSAALPSRRTSWQSAQARRSKRSVATRSARSRAWPSSCARAAGAMSTPGGSATAPGAAFGSA